MNVIHPIRRLDGQGFDVLDLFFNNRAHHLPDRSLVYQVTQLPANLLTVLTPDFFILPIDIEREILCHPLRPRSDQLTVAVQCGQYLSDGII